MTADAADSTADASTPPQAAAATVDAVLTDWSGPLGLPRFEAIGEEGFEDAVSRAMDTHLGEIEAIAENPASPTVANTVDALEKAGRALSRIAAIFFLKAGTHTNETIQAAERTLAPRFARHASAIAMNRALFRRVDALWQSRDGLDLTGEQLRVLERHWKDFVRAGAALAPAEQQRLAAINEELATLGTRFSQNVLKDEADWALFLDGAGDLDGLPAWLTDAMAEAAGERGRPGSHALTLARSIVVPFLTFSKRRDLRETAFKAWVSRGETSAERDNRTVIARVLALRAEKARLLGYEHFAAYKLDDTMAGTAEAVTDLLDTVWERARARAGEEAAEIEALIAEAGRNHRLEPWDWRHYAEQIRQRRFSFSDEDVKPYMRLDRVIEAAFSVAGRLFGLTFEEVKGVPLHHPDARIWRVRDADGSHRAVFIGDYFARASKRSGAWKAALQVQARLTGDTPIVYNVMNFAKPPTGRPAFLSFDDARTLFHEFGHALHGMLSDVTYPSLAGTRVARDFVELPSQLYEHWLTVPEVLGDFARHAETGEPMPKALLDKVLAARTFGAGFDTVEYTSSALVDMAFHRLAEAPADPAGFEREVLAGIGMPEAIDMRHRSPHFLHVFSGDGYSAGYYSYMWSEVLDADAFAAFEAAGDPFHAATAEKLRRHILSVGGTLDAETAYTAFRGRMPTPEAMLAKRGL